MKSAQARGCLVAVDDDGREYFTARDLIEAPVREDDKYYTVKTGDTMRKIAWRLYRDPTVFRVLADYALRDGHDTLFPDRDLQPGMELRGPSDAQLARILSSTKTRA